MQRQLYRLMAGVAAIALSAPAAISQELTIFWAEWDPANYLQELVNEYEAETGVTVTVETTPWQDFQTKAFTEFNARGSAYGMIVCKQKGQLGTVVEQYTKRVPKLCRFVNEMTGGSAVESGGIELKPGDYQILVNFLTGSLGRFLSDATFGVKEALDKDFEGMKDIPVVKEFFSDPYDPLKSQKYHTNIAGIYGAHKLEQMYIKGPERDLIKLQEVRENRGKELRMHSQAQDVERQLKSLRVRLRAAQNQGDTAREKELRDRIGKIKNGLITCTQSS